MDIVNNFKDRLDDNIYNEIKLKLKTIFGRYTNKFIDMDNNNVIPLPSNNTPAPSYQQLTKRFAGKSRRRIRKQRKTKRRK
jgi:hypothetical protein